MVAVADHDLQPFTQKIAGCDFIVHVHPVARAFSPGEISEPVGPIEIPLLEYFLVQTGSVEPGSLGKFYVMPESLVRRGCPYSVRVETLVQDQTLEVFPVVQVHFPVRNVDFPHPGI